MKARLKKKIPPGRTLEQLQNHYQVEKALAAKLKTAARDQRPAIYRHMYEELCVRVPDHRRLQRPKDRNSSETAHASKLRLIEGRIDKTTVFVEFGPGDCSFLLDVCKRVKKAYGIDISDQRQQKDSAPSNFELVIYDGYDPNIKEAADIVFSDQVIEHLHPEDTVLHFQLVNKLLKSGGTYIFRMPHRFTGPHDVSGYFSDDAEGFHLKEWTYHEIAQLLKSSMYSSWWGYWCFKRIQVKIPFACFIAAEYSVSMFPRRIRKSLSKLLFPSLIVVARK